MQENLTIQQYYSIMGVNKIIFIDDAAKSREKWESIVYDFLKLSSIRQKEIVNKINDNNLKSIFQRISESLPNNFDWDNCPKDNIKYGLERDYNCKETLCFYNKLDEYDVSNWSNFMLKYGIGINKESIYLPNLLFVEDDNREPIPVSIITDWAKTDEDFFDEELHDLCDGNFVCIIDDNINQNRRAKDIVQYICDKHKEEKDKGIFLILSSTIDKSLEEIDEKIYIELVTKGTNETDEIVNKEVESTKALLKSCYGSLIRNYRENKINSINKACTASLQNINTVIYNANIARIDGTTGFIGIKNLLGAYEEFEFEKDDKTIRNMTKLAWALSKGTLEESVTNNYDEDFKTYIDYDYKVNEKYMTIQCGDIFEIRNNYYVLIGQSCDLMIRTDGKRKNKIGKLIKAETVDRNALPTKTTDQGGRTVFIENFKDNKSLKIFCDSEYYIDIRLLDLCSFNENGNAEIDIYNDIPMANHPLYTEGQLIVRKNIVEAFSLIDKPEELKKYESLFIKWPDPGPNITIVDFQRKDSIISYPINRVANIKRFSMLLYKLNIEHEERMGFDALYTDLVNKQKISLTINGKYISDIDCIIQMSTDKNRNDNLNKLKWFISCEDLKKSLSGYNICNDMGGEKKYYIFEGSTGVDVNCRMKWKKYKNEDNTFYLYLTIDKNK